MGAEETPKARLVRVSESGEKTIIELDRPSMIIGRDLNCDVVVEKYEEISREHCGLRRYPDGSYAITDFGSRNGTFVNGDRIFEETALKHGDQIRLCSRLTFTFDSPTPIPKPSPHEPTRVAVTAKVPRKPPQPEVGSTTIAKEIDQELQEKGFGSVMKDLVKQARKKPKPPPKEDKPNVYW